jgi:hypothetical protein
MASVLHDFEAFAAKAEAAKRADPSQVARAGLNLVDGAIRIRRGGDGLYGDVEKPITKQAEAVGEWLKSLERDATTSGPAFRRSAEMREALVAAAEEVDRATTLLPDATRFKNALYSDAIDVLGESAPSPRPWLPWVIVSALGGILVGILFSSRKRR